MTRETKQEMPTVCEPSGLGIPHDFFSRLYASCGRPFPWRDEKASPFGILLAEILLKQTRAENVARVWPSLVSRYNNAGELAIANPDDLFKMIAVLGFGNQRVRALIDLASSIIQTGDLPMQPKDLIKLPYVGMYTAHAVACFAFGQRVPMVDLSIVRIISRFTGIKPPTDIRRAAIIWDIAWALLPQQCFKEHNYGLLDFAALVCRPRSPQCSKCPIAAKCAHAKHVLTGENQLVLGGRL